MIESVASARLPILGGVPGAERGKTIWPITERARLVEHRQRATESFDRAVSTISGGALVLSISFIHELAPHPRHTWIVIVAWISFVTALLSILVSFLTSISRYDEIIALMDAEAATIGPGKKRTKRLNRIAVTFLIFGVVWLVLFACLNVEHV